jgi:hypothetical protein
VHFAFLKSEENSTFFIPSMGEFEKINFTPLLYCRAVGENNFFGRFRMFYMKMKLLQVARTPQKIFHKKSTHPNVLWAQKVLTLGEKKLLSLIGHNIFIRTQIKALFSAKLLSIQSAI